MSMGTHSRCRNRWLTEDLAMRLLQQMTSPGIGFIDPCRRDRPQAVATPLLAIDSR